MFIGAARASNSGWIEGGSQIEAELIKRAFKGGCRVREGKTELRRV
jgi:hypothetical protein